MLTPIINETKRGSAHTVAAPPPLGDEARLGPHGDRPGLDNKDVLGWRKQVVSRKRRTGLRALTCAAALLGLLASASPALASRAFLEPYLTKYEADAGEANQVAITAATNEEALRYKTAIEIEDPGATKLFREAFTDRLVRRANINPSWGTWHHGGCKAVDDSEFRVWCVVEEGQFHVRLGDRDDRFDMRPFASASVRTSVSGGPGADVLIGGPATDLLNGGGDDDELSGGPAGADMLSGVPGRDTASYTERTVPITVTLPEPAAPASTTSPAPGTSPVEGFTIETWGAANFVARPVAGDDGASGEGDDVQADVERVLGGDAGDSLVGSSAGNELEGRWGDDNLYGAGGGDRLEGGLGDDHLSGATGEDVLYDVTGTDRLNGGAGDDTIDSRFEITTPVSGADLADDLNGGSGDDTILAQDGSRDRIDCGSGTDTVVADPIDSFRDCDPQEIRFGP